MGNWSAGSPPGDLPRAFSLFEQALDICRHADLPNYVPRVAPALGASYMLSGRFADAVPLLTWGLEPAMELERVDLQAFCRLALGEAQLLAGYLEEAQVHAEWAPAQVRRTPWSTHVLHEHARRARKAVRRADPWANPRHEALGAY